MPTDDALLFDSRFLAKLEQLQLLSRTIFRGQQRAERRSRQLGSSLEFADYRDYTPGDDLRSIDWNIYGRLDRLFVKLYEEEQDLPVYFLVDASASMRWSPGTERLTKLDQARRIAAALSYIALANLDRVNIFYFSSGLERDAGLSRGPSQFHKLLAFLKSVPEVVPGGTELLPALRTFAQRVKRRGLVFILSDFFDADGGAEALRLLRHRQFDVQVVQILDPEERAPSCLGDLRLLDAETPEAREITVDATLLRRYRAAFDLFLRGLQSFCVAHQIGYVEASTAVAFEDLVLRVLRGGAILR